MKFGSIASGIDAASIAWNQLGFNAAWFSEIADFPSKVLSHHYTEIPNYGDMVKLPNLIESNEIDSPEMICGGTPCQAFSFAGWKKGLADERGLLTIKFVEIVNKIDFARQEKGKKKSIVLWENVEGVLGDKKNAFGILLSALAGLETELKVPKWTSSGALLGPYRNLAWRVLDAKYFGLPQQRKRIFLVATDASIDPTSILFEETYFNKTLFNYKKELYLSKSIQREPTLFDEESSNINNPLVKTIKNTKFEVFRDYTDCLYTAYGTKWNGNAAANNGSLFISQNDRVRRLTPVECERLMGFPDNYTLIPGSSDTNRYQAIGNSWAIPVIKWIGSQIKKNNIDHKGKFQIESLTPNISLNESRLYLFKEDFIQIGYNKYLNLSLSSNKPTKGDIFKIIDFDPEDKFYLSLKGVKGILRRQKEKKQNVNTKLTQLFDNFLKSQHSYS